MIPNLSLARNVSTQKLTFRSSLSRMAASFASLPNFVLCVAKNLYLLFCQLQSLRCLLLFVTISLSLGCSPRSLQLSCNHRYLFGSSLISTATQNSLISTPAAFDAACIAECTCRKRKKKQEEETDRNRSEY